MKIFEEQELDESDPDYENITKTDFDNPNAVMALHVKYIVTETEFKLLVNVGPEVKELEHGCKLAIIQTLSKFVEFMNQDPSAGENIQ